MLEMSASSGRAQTPRIDPTMAVLEECIAEMSTDKENRDYSRTFCAELASLFQNDTAWYAQIGKLPSAALVRF